MESRSPARPPLESSGLLCYPESDDQSSALEMGLGVLNMAPEDDRFGLRVNLHVANGHPLLPTRRLTPGTLHRAPHRQVVCPTITLGYDCQKGISPVVCSL